MRLKSFKNTLTILGEHHILGNDKTKHKTRGNIMPRLTLDFLNSTLASFELQVIKHNDNRVRYSLVAINCKEIFIAEASTLAKMQELISSHKSSYCFKDEDGYLTHDLNHLSCNFKKYLKKNYRIHLELYGKVSVDFVPSYDLS